PGGACDCPGRDFAICPNSDPQSPGCPAPWKDDLSPTFANGALAAFQADAMFGAETADGDVWGLEPAVVNAALPDPANLHLSPADVVARDAGLTLDPSVFDPPADIDGDPRPQG